MRYSNRQPKEMYLLALTEMCQRFAFWGVGNLLVLYLVQSHHFSDAKADHLFGIFTGIAFILPILGGHIADRCNYRMPVVWGMGLTSFGCLLISTGHLPLIFAALALLAVGGAIFTPSIYAILGNLYHDKHHLRDAGFSIYYASVNVGVFMAMIILGYLGQTGHWSLVFLTAGCIQLFGLIPFLIAIKEKKIQELHSLNQKRKPKRLHSHEKQRIAVICILALFSTLFWMAYNQGGSSMNLFALRFTERMVGSFEIPPTWLLSSESLYLILLAFPLAKLYFYLAKKKCDPSPPTKTALSMFAIGICFFIMSLGARAITPHLKAVLISPFFPLAAYGFMALGEMLICPIGLALITHISPKKYTAMLIGVWYFCIGAGFYLGGVIAPFMTTLETLSEFFNLLTATTFISGLILLIFTKKLNKMRHLDSL